MRNSSILASCILLASASAIAQGVLIPSTAQGPFAGTSGNYFTAAGINHFQMIYDTSNLTTQGVLAPINITNIQFLYGGGTTPAAVTTFPLVEVYVQQSAVDWTLQNTSFAANNTVPLPTTPNYTGPVTTQVGTYYVDIPLTIPFAYDPTTGTDLLIEVFVNGAPAPALTAGITQACTFTATPPANFCNVKRSVGSVVATVGTNSAFVPIVNLLYGPVPGAASYATLGAGCVAHYASLYELFAAPANFDLANSAMSFIPTGTGGYVATRTGAFLPVGSVQPTPIALVMNDDSEVTQTFTVGSFQGPNGPWTSFSIVSNGVISELAGHPAAAAGGGSPNNNTYLNAAPTAFYNLADWDPSAATGGGNVWYEESAGVTTITWENVPNWTATPPAAGVNTFQFQLYPSGIVTIAWSGANLSSFGNNGGALIGYSPGGTNLEPGATDISAIGAGSVQIVAADIPPTTLSSVNRPVFGTTWNLTVSNIEPSSFVGIDIFGVADPGVNDLSFLGLPGCGIRSSLDVTSAWIVTGSTHNYGLAIPAGQPALQGFNLYTTSATFQAIPQNPFGAMTANGIRGTLGPI